MNIRVEVKLCLWKLVTSHDINNPKQTEIYIFLLFDCCETDQQMLLSYRQIKLTLVYDDII